jgi:hypothetical protein
MGRIKMSRRIMTIVSALTIVVIALMVVDTAEAKIVENGLVHYWSFDNVKKNTVPDLAGNNDVELVRGKSPPLLGGGQSDPKIVEGRMGQAVEFDGDGDYAQSSKEIEITGSDPRTLSAWVRFNKFFLKQVPVGWGWEGETPQICEGELYAITAWDGPRIALWGICNDHVSTKNFEQDTWAHVTATYDNETELKIYVDGEEAYNKTDVNPLKTGDAQMTLGKKIFTFPDRAWTNGVVDEVAIYDRALNPDEVMQNFMADEFGAVAVGSAGKLTTAWGKIKGTPQ